MDFAKSSNSFSYGHQDKWEIRFEFSFDTEIEKSTIDKRSEVDNYHYETYTNVGDDGEETYTWVDTDGEIEFNSIIERNYNNPAYKDIDFTISYRRFFSPAQGNFNFRTFYVDLGFGKFLTRKTSDYITTNYIDIGYEFIDEPENPIEGDIYGDIYNEEIDRTVTSTTTYKNSYNNYFAFLGIGHRYDFKHELFNIPNVKVGIDIQYFTLGIIMEEHIYTRSVDYNEDVYGSSYYKEDYYDEDTDDELSISLEGPRIDLFIKYFF